MEQKLSERDYIPIPINYAEGLWSCLESLEKRLEKNGKARGLFRVAGNSSNCNILERELLFEGNFFLQMALEPFRLI